LRKLLESPRAVAGLTLNRIDEDTRLFELAGGDLHLRLVEPAQAGRLAAQNFIARAYRRVFDAQLHSFYPSLISLHGTADELNGAAGARYAEGQDLFLEQYLPVPVETQISRLAGRRISRDRIVELGNLSVTRPALTYPFIGMIGGWFGAEQLTLQQILGAALAPIAWLMGIPWEDASKVGALLGIKTVLNEFLAYLDLAALIRDGGLSPRSVTIASYALCGFANFGSLAILLGGIGGLAPTRRGEVAALGLRSILSGSLATFMTACVAGIIL